MYMITHTYIRHVTLSYLISFTHPKSEERRGSTKNPLSCSIHFMLRTFFLLSISHTQTLSVYTSHTNSLVLFIYHIYTYICRWSKH